MVKIGFVLLSNSCSPAPSTRISVLNMFPYLRRAGFEPSIVFEPDSPNEQPAVPALGENLHAQGYRIVYFQKVHGPHVSTLVASLRSLGIRTVYGVCDLVDVAMAESVDVTVAVTDYLRSLYPAHLQHKIQVVHDGIERPDLNKCHGPEPHSLASTDLSAVLVTSHALTSLPLFDTIPSWLRVTVVGRYPPALTARLTTYRWAMSSMPWRDRLPYLRFLLNKRIRLEPWSPDAAYDAMLQADVGIIPIDTSGPSVAGSAVPAWKLKSENRLTMKMSLGLPVIATPIPSYRPVVVHGENGFFAESADDWKACLEALRNPELRRRMGSRARDSVTQAYSMDAQAKKLISVLSDLIA